MKILLISFSEHYTYQETIYNLHVQLNGIDNIELWTMGTRDRKYDILLTDKNILVDCPSRPGITKDTFNNNKLNAIVKRINEINPDAIMFYSAHIWNLFLTFKLKGRYKIVHVIHDVVPHKGDRQEKFVYMYNWMTARLADSIVLHNELFIKVFCSKFKYPVEKVKFTELWRRYEEYSPLKHTGRCLFFGRINYYKGLSHLLDIVKKCPNIDFDIVGRVDNGLEEIVNEFRFLPNVHLDTNYVDGNTMRNYFHNADWIILPYDSATQSGVIIDAYSFSRPVIAFNVGALGEQVSEDLSGFLIDSGNTELFVKVIKTCIELPKASKDELSYNAWKYGYRKYSIQNGANRFLKLFD